MCVVLKYYNLMAEILWRKSPISIYLSLVYVYISFFQMFLSFVTKPWRFSSPITSICLRFLFVFLFFSFYYCKCSVFFIYPASTYWFFQHLIDSLIYNYSLIVPCVKLLRFFIHIRVIFDHCIFNCDVILHITNTFLQINTKLYKYAYTYTLT